MGTEHIASGRKDTLVADVLDYGLGNLGSTHAFPTDFLWGKSLNLSVPWFSFCKMGNSPRSFSLKISLPDLPR